jgi:hypothetical protein
MSFFKDIFMYATNMHNFGHLINADNFNTSLTRPEMYQIFDNYDVRNLLKYQDNQFNFILISKGLDKSFYSSGIL